MAAVAESVPVITPAGLTPRILAALTPQPRTTTQLRAALGIAPSDKAANAALSEALAALVADKQLVPIRDLYVRNPNRSKKPMTVTKQLPADVVLAAAFDAAEAADREKASRAIEAAAAQARKEQADREAAAQHISAALAAYGVPDVTLTGEDLDANYALQIVPGFSLTLQRLDRLKEAGRWDAFGSLAEIGAAIRKHQDLERQRQIAEEMEQKRPQIPSEPRVFGGAALGTGIIFQSHDLTLTLRPFAGDIDKSYEMSHIPAQDARALADAIVSAALRREPRLAAIGWSSYPIVCGADALTFLRDDEALTIPLMSDVRDQFATALADWADSADALAAWYEELKKVAPDINPDDFPF